MSELSERVRALTTELEKHCEIRWTDTPYMGDQRYAGLTLGANQLIEQALLRERRLAMEFAIQVLSDGDLTYRHKMVEKLRAAAEKEVVNG